MPTTVTLTELKQRALARLTETRFNVDDSVRDDVQVIADFLNWADEQERKDAEDKELLDGILGARARASLSDWDNRNQAAAEVTSVSEVMAINRMLERHSPAVRRLAEARTEVWTDFDRRLRCSVCGMTEKQAEAAGHDCENVC